MLKALGKRNNPALDLPKVLLCFPCFTIIALLTFRLGLSKKKYTRI